MIRSTLGNPLYMKVFAFNGRDVYCEILSQYLIESLVLIMFNVDNREIESIDLIRQLIRICIKAAVTSLIVCHKYGLWS